MECPAGGFPLAYMYLGETRRARCALRVLEPTPFAGLAMERDAYWEDWLRRRRLFTRLFRGAPVCSG